MLPPSVLALIQRDPAGLLRRRDVVALGFSDMAIRRWVDAELLARVARGLYRRPGRRHPREELHIPLRYLEAKVGRGGVLTGAAGLSALGVPGVDVPAQPMVLLDHHLEVRVREAPWSIRNADLGAVWTEHHHGLVVAEPARCLADLATEGPTLPTEEDLLDVVDATRSARQLSAPSLADRWASMRRHPGAVRLLDLYDRGLLDLDSAGERRAFDALFGRRPPAPDCQVWVLPSRRADFVFIAAALVIEYHGIAAHRDRIDADAVRAHELTAAGWHVIVVTRSLVRPHAERCASTIHQLRRTRERLIADGAIPRPSLPAQRRRRVPLQTVHPLG